MHIAKTYLAAIAAVFVSVVTVTNLRAAHSISTTVWSKYLNSDGAVFLEEPVIQTVLGGNYDSGLYWSVFHSAGLNDSDLSSDYGDEIDWTIGWSGAIGGGFSLDASVAYWDIVGIFDSKPADVLYANITLSKEVKPNLRLSVSGDRYLPTDSSVFNGGYRFTVGCSTSVRLGEYARLSLAPSLLWEDGIFGLNDGWCGKFATSVDWTVGKMAVSFPKVVVAGPLFNATDGRRTTAVYGGGMSFKF